MACGHTNSTSEQSFNEVWFGDASLIGKCSVELGSKLIPPASLQACSICSTRWTGLRALSPHLDGPGSHYSLARSNRHSRSKSMLHQADAHTLSQTANTSSSPTTGLAKSSLPTYVAPSSMIVTELKPAGCWRQGMSGLRSTAQEMHILSTDSCRADFCFLGALAAQILH